MMTADAETHADLIAEAHLPGHGDWQGLALRLATALEEAVVSDCWSALCGACKLYPGQRHTFDTNCRAVRPATRTGDLDAETHADYRASIIAGAQEWLQGGPGSAAAEIQKLCDALEEAGRQLEELEGLRVQLAEMRHNVASRLAVEQTFNVRIAAANARAEKAERQLAEVRPVIIALAEAIRQERNP